MELLAILLVYLFGKNAPPSNTQDKRQQGHCECCEEYGCDCEN